MNWPRFIWGILCLALAALLAVLNIVLPPENLMFMVGNTNMPWVPPIAFALVGILLLATSARGAEEAEERARQRIEEDPEKVALNKRMEAIAWGFFLIMLGGFVFIPESVVEKGLWSIGVGVIMLGLNAARYSKQIKMSGFTTFLGVISVLGGVFQLAGLQAYDGAILLVVLGALLLLKPWFDKHRLFGRAEES